LPYFCAICRTSAPSAALLRHLPYFCAICRTSAPSAVLLRHFLI
jgi:hypothetical protein